MEIEISLNEGEKIEVFEGDIAGYISAQNLELVFFLKTPTTTRG